MATDIYIGELFLNTVDNILYSRNSTGIIVISNQGLNNTTTSTSFAIGNHINSHIPGAVTFGAELNGTYNSQVHHLVMTSITPEPISSSYTNTLKVNGDALIPTRTDYSYLIKITLLCKSSASSGGGVHNAYIFVDNVNGSININGDYGTFIGSGDYALTGFTATGTSFQLSVIDNNAVADTNYTAYLEIIETGLI